MPKQFVTKNPIKSFISEDIKHTKISTLENLNKKMLSASKNVFSLSSVSNFETKTYVENAGVESKQYFEATSIEDCNAKDHEIIEFYGYKSLNDQLNGNKFESICCFFKNNLSHK